MIRRRWMLAALITGGVLAGGGLVVGQADSGFWDVGFRHPQVADIQWAADEGLVFGYPDGDFRPDQTVSPRQIATVIERAFPEGMTRADLTSFVRRGSNREYKRGEWEVSDSRWDDAKGRPCAPYSIRGCDSNEDLQLAHTVPMREANESGGWRWSVETKEAFYLDVENLFLLSSAEKQAKGDDLVNAQWQPHVSDACDYVLRWRAVKRKWGLTIDPAEEQQLAALCDEEAHACDEMERSVLISIAESEGLWPFVRPIWELRARYGYLAVPEARERVKNNPGADWGKRDPDGDGYPCEGWLGEGY